METFTVNDEINKLKEERDRLKEQNENQMKVINQLHEIQDSLKEENERLKGYRDLAKKSDEENDSLKQLNSELVKSLDEIIRYYERHYRIPYVWQPYKMAKEAFSKASDGYTKAKD